MKDEVLVQIRIKHLEFIQAAIARMAGNSSQTKVYSASLTAAIVAFVATTKIDLVLWLYIPILLIFGFLDGQYLRLERAFRSQFNSLRTKPYDEDQRFEISTRWKAGYGLTSGFWSWSVWLYYLPLSAIVAASAALI